MHTAKLAQNTLKKHDAFVRRRVCLYNADCRKRDHWTTAVTQRLTFVK